MSAGLVVGPNCSPGTVSKHDVFSKVMIIFVNNGPRVSSSAKDDQAYLRQMASHAVPLQQQNESV